MKRTRMIHILLSLLLCLTMVSPALADVLKLPDGVKVIEEEAFFGDTSLNEIVLPEGTERIESKAFAESSLQWIHIPESVHYIANDALFAVKNKFVIDTPKDSWAYNWVADRYPVTNGVGLIHYSFMNQLLVGYEFDIDTVEIVPSAYQGKITVESLNDNLQIDANGHVKVLDSGDMQIAFKDPNGNIIGVSDGIFSNHYGIMDVFKFFKKGQRASTIPYDPIPGYVKIITNQINQYVEQPASTSVGGGHGRPRILLNDTLYVNAEGLGPWTVSIIDGEDWITLKQTSGTDRIINLPDIYELSINNTDVQRTGHIRFTLGKYEYTYEIIQKSLGEMISVESATLKYMSPMVVGLEYDLALENVQPEDADYVFGSSDDSVLQISASGHVKVLKPGTAELIVYSGDTQQTMAVTVPNVFAPGPGTPLTPSTADKAIPFSVEVSEEDEMTDQDYQLIVNGIGEWIGTVIEGSDWFTLNITSGTGSVGPAGKTGPLYTMADPAEYDRDAQVAFTLQGITEILTFHQAKAEVQPIIELETTKATWVNPLYVGVSFDVCLSEIQPEGADITWSSSDNAVIQISPEGHVNVVGAGEAEILLVSGMKEYSIPVAVPKVFEILEGDVQDPILPVGTTIQIPYTAGNLPEHDVEIPGGEKYLSVKGIGEWSAMIINDVDWLTLNMTSGTSKAVKLSDFCEMEPNPYYVPRRAEILFALQNEVETLVIEQEAAALPATPTPTSSPTETPEPTSTPEPEEPFSFEAYFDVKKPSPGDDVNFIIRFTGVSEIEFGISMIPPDDNPWAYGDETEEYILPIRNISEGVWYAIVNYYGKKTNGETVSGEYTTPELHVYNRGEHILSAVVSVDEHDEYVAEDYVTFQATAENVVGTCMFLWQLYKNGEPCGEPIMHENEMYSYSLYRTATDTFGVELSKEETDNVYYVEVTVEDEEDTDYIRSENVTVTHIEQIIYDDPETEAKDFTYDLSGNEAIITGYNGTATKLTIPEQIDGHTVTGIGINAFKNGNFIGKLTLPPTIRTIGAGAFSNCKDLYGSLDLPNGLTTIGAYAFENCMRLSGSLVIPDSVTEIYGYAFVNCSGFGTLQLSANMEIIRSSVFEGCTGFHGTLILPEGITTIELCAFNSCSFTGTLEIPATVTTIGTMAFINCTGFDHLILHEGLVTIGHDAFNGCSGFSGSLKLPSTLQKIEKYAFMDCYGFTGSLKLNEGLHTVEKEAFYGCNGFNGQLILPSTLTTLGEFAFAHCEGLTGSLKIPGSLVEIPRGAFAGDFSLSGSLLLENGTRTIASNAFMECTGLSSIVFNQTIEKVGPFAFCMCSGLNGNLAFPTSVKEIGMYSFQSCTSYNGDLAIPGTVEVIDSAAFHNTNFRHVYLGDGISELPHGFFNKGIHLEAVRIPDSLSDTESYGNLFLSEDTIIYCSAGSPAEASLSNHLTVNHGTWPYTLPQNGANANAQLFGSFDEHVLTLPLGGRVTPPGTVTSSGDGIYRVTLTITGWSQDESGNDRYRTHTFEGQNRYDISLTDTEWANEFVLDTTQEPLNIPGEYTINLWASTSDANGSGVKLDSMTVKVLSETSISGCITLATGEPLSSIDVYILDPSTHFVGYAITDQDGKWKVADLLPDHDYTIRYGNIIYTIGGDGNTVRPGDYLESTAVYTNENTNITFTMQQEGLDVHSICVGTAVDFNVTAPGATWVRFIADGREYEEYPVVNDKAEFSRVISSSGNGIRTIVFQADTGENGETEYSNPQELTILSEGDLLTPTEITIPNPIYENTSVVISWNSVPNATNYTIYLYDQDGNLISKKIEDAPTVSFDVQDAGYYQMNIMSWGPGYSQSSYPLTIKVFEEYEPWNAWVQSTKVYTYTSIHPLKQYGYVDNEDIISVLAEDDNWYYIRMITDDNDTVYRYIPNTTLLGDSKYIPEPKIIGITSDLNGETVTFLITCNNDSSGIGIRFGENTERLIKEPISSANGKVFKVEVPLSDTGKIYVWAIDKNENPYSIREIEADYGQPAPSELPTSLSDWHINYIKDIKADLPGSMWFSCNLDKNGVIQRDPSAIKVSAQFSRVEAEEKVAAFAVNYLVGDIPKYEYIDSSILTYYPGNDNQDDYYAAEFSINPYQMTDGIKQPGYLKNITTQEDIYGNTYNHYKFEYVFLPLKFAKENNGSYTIDHETVQYLIQNSCAGMIALKYLMFEVGRPLTEFSSSLNGDDNARLPLGIGQQYRLLDSKVTFSAVSRIIWNDGQPYCVVILDDDDAGDYYEVMLFTPDEYQLLADGTNTDLKFDYRISIEQTARERTKITIESMKEATEKHEKTERCLVTKWQENGTWHYAYTQPWTPEHNVIDKKDFQLEKHFTVMNNQTMDLTIDTKFYFMILDYSLLSRVDQQEFQISYDVHRKIPNNDQAYFTLLYYSLDHMLNPLTGRNILTGEQDPLYDQHFVDTFESLLKNRYSKFSISDKTALRFIEHIRNTTIYEQYLYLFSLYEYGIELLPYSTKKTNFTGNVNKSNTIMLTSDSYTTVYGLNNMITTFFHEAGHGLDWYAHSKSNTAYASGKSSYVREAIEQDLRNNIYRCLIAYGYTENQCNAIADYWMEYNRSEKQVECFEKFTEGLDDELSENEKAFMWVEAEAKAKTEMEACIAKAFPGNKLKNACMPVDVFRGITYNYLIHSAGHNIPENGGYWYEKGKDTNRQAPEAFAEYFSSKMYSSVNASMYQNNWDLMPLTCEKLDQLMGEMLNYYRAKYASYRKYYSIYWLE